MKCKYGEFFPISPPDSSMLRMCIISMRGPERNNAEFAVDCGILAPRISRMVSGSLKKPVDLDLLEVLYENRDSTSTIKFDELAIAAGWGMKDNDGNFIEPKSNSSNNVFQSRMWQNDVKFKILNLLSSQVPIITLDKIVQVCDSEGNPCGIGFGDFSVGLFEIPDDVGDSFCSFAFQWLFELRKFQKSNMIYGSHSIIEEILVYLQCRQICSADFTNNKYSIVVDSKEIVEQTYYFFEDKDIGDLNVSVIFYDEDKNEFFEYNLGSKKCNEKSKYLSSGIKY